MFCSNYFTLGSSGDKVAMSVGHSKKVCGGNGLAGQWSVKKVDVGGCLDLLILNVLFTGKKCIKAD